MSRVSRRIAAAVLGLILGVIAGAAATAQMPVSPTIKISDGPTAEVGGKFTLTVDWAKCNGIAKVVAVATDKSGTVIGSKSHATVITDGRAILALTTTAKAGDTVTFTASARDAGGDDIAVSAQKTATAK